MRKLLLTFFIAIVCASNLWAWSGSGTSSSPYLITSTSDWNTLATNVNNGTSYSGTYFELTANITISNTVGSYTDSRPFSGNFNGNGHTLTLSVSDQTNQGTAPFRYISGATIRFIKTTGTVNGTMHCSGLVGFAANSSVNNIYNCEVAATITCGGSTHTHCGGVLGHGLESKTTITNCLFSGSVSGATSTVGLIYGWGNSGNHALVNCLSTGTCATCDNIVLIAQRGTWSYNGTYSATPTSPKQGGNGNQSNSNLLSLLGTGWEISGDKVIPILSLRSFTGSGTAADPYCINSIATWDYLVDKVNGGATDYLGKFFRQTAKINVTTMLANNQAFTGTYDGNGHTMQVFITTAAQVTAPFRYVNGATIKNLHVDGRISTNQKFVGSIIGNAHGSNTITNCRSSVQITSSVSGDGTGGGLIGRLQNSGSAHTTLIEGCVFEGKLIGSNTSNWGGFIGWTEINEGVHLTIRNCLFAPAQLNINTSSCYTFARRNSDSYLSITNSYYTQSIGTTQGKMAYSIGAGTYVAVEAAGTPTATYDVSRLNFYGTSGLTYNGACYGCSGSAISLNLSGAATYAASAGTLTGSANPYTLTMTSANTVLSAVSFSSATSPLTFEAKEAGAQVTYNRSISIPIEYSLNGGAWTTYSSAITLTNVGDKVSFRGNHSTYYIDASSYARFTCSKDCYIYGNIMSLVNKTCYATATTLTDAYTFFRLFYSNTHIKNHSTNNLVLPATTLASHCYQQMFYGCTGLTSAPVLPAATLADYCYYYMFQNCTGLTSAPALPATTLADYCYYGMFYGCTGLTSAPALPATTLASHCYFYMFYGCTGLTSAPALPATTLADYCYYGMFYGCTHLTSAPALPATTLANYCYSNMFNGCTHLTSAPELSATTLVNSCYSSMFSGCIGLTSTPALPATTLANYCYDSMFKNCTNLTSAPTLPATTLAHFCYQQMFNGCTRLTSAPELPATTLADYCYRYMFQGCSSLTSAPELPATTMTTQCYTYLFAGCTGLTSAPALPATTLANYCYSNMFNGCTHLTSAPELPATTLTSSCYNCMFSGCTGLTSAPELPSTTLASNCYSYMFNGCTGLTSAPELPATTLAHSCYYYMFYGCTGLTSAPELPATTLTTYCYGNMFYGCTGLTTAPVLPATRLESYCYQSMFNGCTNLSSVTCYATSRYGVDATSNWLNGVASSGTFYAPESSLFLSETRGVNGIPTGWIVYPIVTAPTVVDDLVYTGSEQALIHAGTASGGTIQYKLGDGSWSTSVPTTTNAGDYMVYYKVVGDASHADFTPDDNTIAVSITKAQLSCTADDKEVTYGDAAPEYTATYSGWQGSDNASAISGTLDFVCDYSVGSNAGSSFTITPSGVSATNYAITFHTGTLTVNKATATITSAPTPVADLTYDGAEHSLVSAGSVSAGTMKYSLDDSDYSTAIPTASTIGTHRVYYMLDGGQNYTTVSGSLYVETTIAGPRVADNTDPSTTLTALYADAAPMSLLMNRTIYADGDYNTICLPFDVSESDFANPAHPLYGYERLKAFRGAQVTGSGQDLSIDVFVQDATEIVAGVPYLITYPSNHGDIVNPLFANITVTATEPGNVSANGVTFQGMFAPVHITSYEENTTQDYLFLAANNQLAWPANDATSMRGFRAYFIIDRQVITPSMAPRNSRARIVEHTDTATDMETVTGNPSPVTQKLIENGLLIVIKNGVRYNAQGQLIK